MASSYSVLRLKDLIGCWNSGLNSAGNCEFSSGSHFVVTAFKQFVLIGVVSNLNFPFGDGVLFSSRSNGFRSLVFFLSSFAQAVCSLPSKHLIASSRMSAFSIGG